MAWSGRRTWARPPRPSPRRCPSSTRTPPGRQFRPSSDLLELVAEAADQLARVVPVGGVRVAVAPCVAPRGAAGGNARIGDAPAALEPKRDLLAREDLGPETEVEVEARARFGLRGAAEERVRIDLRVQHREAETDLAERKNLRIAGLLEAEEVQVERVDVES